MGDAVELRQPNRQVLQQQTAVHKDGATQLQHSLLVGKEAAGKRCARRKGNGAATGLVCWIGHRDRLRRDAASPLHAVAQPVPPGPLVELRKRRVVAVPVVAVHRHCLQQ